MSGMTAPQSRAHLVPFRRPCHDCEVQHLCLPCNLDAEQERELRTAVRRIVPCERGDRIVRMGAPFTCLYIVQSGAVKTQQITVDGDLNLTGFYLEGDLFGLDAIGSATYPCEAVALGATTVCELPFAEFEKVCGRIPPLQRWLLSRLGGQLKAHAVVSSWSARKETESLVLSFFLDLQRRLKIRQKPQAGYYTMPMRKYEVALFLKVTPETLSRTLSVLRRKRLIDIRLQRFRLKNLPAVERYLGL